MNSSTRIRNAVVATVAAAALTGCYTYPVYQPVAVQRLSPAQSAALSDQQLSPADRDRLARDNAQARVDQPAAQTYTYAYAPSAPVYVAPPATYYDPYWAGYGYGYPGFYGAYPFYPSIGLSFGFGGRWGGRGYHGGGFRGHR